MKGGVVMGLPHCGRVAATPLPAIHLYIDECRDPYFPHL